MDVLAILLIAVGLAMDAFAVSIAHGVTLRNSRSGDALKMAASFGFFQGFMPVLGWLGGLSLGMFISGVDHWIAFGILMFIGCKMVYDSTSAETVGRQPKSLTAYVLLVLSVSTSIDALMVGVSFAFLQLPIIIPVAVIGIVTSLLSFLGVSFGNTLGRLFGSRVEAAGGLVLMVIGLKILLEHLI
ncbi:manganese efflux pump MntP family protein [Candidatus Bathyarchaeota archaeon]|nr:manganese efflux pump MntP family protein [Candidatus Bathyarchaeota archaeon]